MNISKEYQEKLITIPEAVAKVKSNQKIVTAMAASEPQGLLSELDNRSDELQNVNIVSCLMMGDYDFLEPEMKGTFLNETWFYGPSDRENHKHGNVTYIPNNLHEAGMKKIENDNLDIFWGTATPMDENGYFSLSLGLTYEKMMIENENTLVVLEINENLPWTLGDTQVHISQIDHLVENKAPLIELPAIEPGEEEKKIGEYVAEMVEDGSTLQLGIGGIPNAIAQSLTDKKDLGVHTEMFTDGMVDLFRAGAITNQKKTLWKGKMVGTFAMGTQKLYDFIDTNLAVEFQQGSVTNDPCVIGQNYKMDKSLLAYGLKVYNEDENSSIVGQLGYEKQINDKLTLRLGDEFRILETDKENDTTYFSTPRIYPSVGLAYQINDKTKLDFDVSGNYHEKQHDDEKRTRVEFSLTRLF